ncbi:MAG: hypothetical protein ACOX7R_00200 [Acetivibrionales bacterium]|jgi:chromosome segregation ATPase
MMGFSKKRGKKYKFDRRILRKNDISLLILDERWNNLFTHIKKSPQIERCEEKLKELLKDQSRLTEEGKNNAVLKKKCMGRIMELTPKVYEENDDEARKEMEHCEKEIKRINIRAAEIEQELERIPDLIKETNLELLEHTVNMVYFKIRSATKRVEQLEALISETREKLKNYIEEKESLSQDDTDIYSYFHDLLGGEEIERLDREYFRQ